MICFTPDLCFCLLTQGCKVNQYESQALREAWCAAGMTETDDPAQADMVLINSCAVTERAISDLAKLTRTLAALCPKPRIIIAGCAVEADLERIAALPGVDEVVRQQDKTTPGLGLASRPVQSGAHFPPLRITEYHRARAVLKVQDGCSHGCTYCIIPATRGASVSREPAAVIAEAKRLAEAGIYELSLCGINLRHYGRDLTPRCDFWDLLAAVDAALAPVCSGQMRLRISSLEPADLHAKALDTLAGSRLVCPHLHLSVQSGSPEILRRMGRGHYSPEDISGFVEELRRIWPVFGLGADFITGFPGETEDHARQTSQVVQGLPLTYAHIFPYSERPGTAAARFPRQVPGHLRRQRAKDLRALVQDKRQDFLRHLLKLPVMTVIPEQTNQGVNEFYVDCQIETTSQLVPGKPVRVRPVAVIQQGLRVAQTDPADQETLP